MPAKFKKALIVGADCETGRAVVLQLAGKGTDVIAVARVKGDLETLEQKYANIAFQIGDGTCGMAKNLIAETKPDLLVLAGGISPKSGTSYEKSWESFSDTYSSATRTAVEFLKAAIEVPLLPGSTVVTFSSNEAMSGCVRRGSYGGAQLKQHNLADYTAWEAERRGLGLRCFTIFPQQSSVRARPADMASRIYSRPCAATSEWLISPPNETLTPNLMANRMTELVDINAGYSPGGWSISSQEMRSTL
ncbi:MAG: NAD-dependent epimerase/dehydratase family protein [Hyphomicrobiales bacterium]